MAKTPNPTPLARDVILTPCNVENYRRLDCKFYDHCLLVACKGRWDSFGCLKCEAFEQGKSFKATDFTGRPSDPVIDFDTT